MRCFVSVSARPVSVLFQLFHFVSVLFKSKARHCWRHATKTRCFVSVCFSFLSQTLAKNQTCFSLFQFLPDQTSNDASYIRRKGCVLFQLFRFVSVSRRIHPILLAPHCVLCIREIACILCRFAFCAFELSSVSFLYLCLLLFLLGCFFWWVCYHLYYSSYFLLAFWVLVGESPQGLQ